MENKNEKIIGKNPYIKPEIVSLDDANSLAGQQLTLCSPTGSGAYNCDDGSQAEYSAPTPQ